MTRTTVKLFGRRYVLRSEKDAYAHTIEAFLTVKPDLFTEPHSGPHVCKGRHGSPLFAPSRKGMNQPQRLANGWYAETCLSEIQKIRKLDALAQYFGWKRGRDWEWQAENRPSIRFIDTEALLARLLNA